jgi:SAM-dependent methyltransferase
VHAARYEFAARTLVGRRVLDVACGTGYGLEILSTFGRSTFGVDADTEALRQASRHGSALAADGGALPFADQTFDAVTSFETLEHLQHRERFVAELARVLRRDGTLMLSTPNANYTRPVDGRPRNPHHIHEYEPDELRTALEKEFGDVKMLGQVISPRFAVSPFQEDQQRLQRTPRTSARVLYWRVLNRLPEKPRDRVSYLTWGHPLYPTEHDYDFVDTKIDSAPVLVVVARHS